ncbi:MAG: hypothetical protein LBH72_00210 [Proteiniphilum sp.]|jgi:glycosyltransferase involved in cell wall biosynthesis|nr:hypothetical protein [Proteiniphilum sp.]
MNKILIFEPFLSGHRLEYIHHLHEEAAKTPGTQYYFAVSDQFPYLKENYLWSKADNIFFLFLDSRHTQCLLRKSKVRRIAGLAGMASGLSKQYGVNETFFICIAEYMPWLPLFFRARSAVSGIIYYIYLYEWKSKGLFARMRDALTLLSVIPFRKYRHIFMLNDPVAAIYLNKRFATRKFRCLPDPCLPLAELKNNGGNLKESLGISAETKIFLHFGSMSYRKGTLNILQAIALLPEEDLEGCCFVFAGRVNDDIKATFHALTGALKERAQIRVFDTFCTTAFLSSLCEACSVILAPYGNTSFSSGVAGYAASFRKPVAVPGEKFIGKLVKRYRLGYLLRDNSAETIAGFIKNTRTFRPVDGTRYVNTHTASDFAQKTLLFES